MTDAQHLSSHIASLGILPEAAEGAVTSMLAGTLTAGGGFDESNALACHSKFFDMHGFGLDKQ